MSLYLLFHSSWSFCVSVLVFLLVIVNLHLFMVILHLSVDVFCLFEVILHLSVEVLYPSRLVLSFFVAPVHLFVSFFFLCGSVVSYCILKV